MEKLIELVYYYNFEVKTFEMGIGLSNSDTDYYGGTINKEKEIRKYKLMIISKEYGFIKWLVDNDKIDRDRVREIDISISFHDEYDGFHSDDEKELLMLLSIQDNPIAFLVSILK